MSRQTLLLFLPLIWLLSCAEEPTVPSEPVSTDVTGTIDASDIVDTDAPTDVTDTAWEDIDAGPPPECTRHEDCISRYCDHAAGHCVDCLLQAHCPIDAPSCLGNRCSPVAVCGEDQPCETGVCDPSTGTCVDCLADDDCAPEQVCGHTVCKAAPPKCQVDFDCLPYGMRCDLATHLCVDCLSHSDCQGPEFCDESSTCTPDLCPADSVSTECSGAGLLVCSQSGASWVPVECPEANACKKGVEGFQPAICSPLICEPNAKGCASDNAIGYCNETGTEEGISPCAGGTVCEEGECKLPRPVIVIVFDTSSSMWGYPGGGVPENCDALAMTCVAPWPICEKEAEGITTMGISKWAFSSLFELFADKVHFSLFRFPQSVSGTLTPQCKSGYYQGHNTLSDDPSEHSTTADGWFSNSLHETLLVPIAESADENNLTAITRWLDFAETMSPVGPSCGSDEDCAPDQACLADSDEGHQCHVHTDPELRPVGQTPIGRTLFYAGEYLRHHVVVDGKSCTVDADCGTPFHRCTDATCTDPGRACRQIAVLLFTDGTESVDPQLDNWFNPRNQAKRFHYGLGCEVDTDCFVPATCESGSCQSPQMTTTGMSCFQTGQFCPGEGTCGEGGPCVPNENTYADPLGVQVLSDLNGEPIQLTVNVVTVGNAGTDAELLAINGGGSHVSVTATDPQALLGALSATVSEKLAVQCD